MNDHTYIITVDGKQVMIAGANYIADALREMYGILDATSDLVGEYYGEWRGNTVDVVVAIY